MTTVTTVSNTGYFYVMYQSSGNSMSYATLYTTCNPWNNLSSTTAILPSTSGTTVTSGTWSYFSVESAGSINSVESAGSIISYFSTSAPTSTSDYIALTNSYLYVYTSGIGGTSQSGYGGAGTGGLAAACFNPTWGGSSALDINDITAFGGIDWTQPNYVAPTPYPPPPSHSPPPPPPSDSPPPPILNIYVGAGSISSGVDGASGALALPEGTSVQVGVTPGSYISYNETSSEQVIDQDIAFCIGGVGGQADTGGTIGSSSNTLPTGSPNWISSSTVNGVFNIIMADGTLYPMPSSPAATSAATSSVLFAIFTPTII
jgi:hypothetical protein